MSAWRVRGTWQPPLVEPSDGYPEDRPQIHSCVASGPSPSSVLHLSSGSLEDENIRRSFREASTWSCTLWLALSRGHVVVFLGQQQKCDRVSRLPCDAVGSALYGLMFDNLTIIRNSHFDIVQALQAVNIVCDTILIVLPTSIKFLLVIQRLVWRYWKLMGNAHLFESP